MVPGGTLLIVPPNDPEAVLIWRLAQAAGIPTLRSGQAHGASLDRERDLLPRIHRSGASRVAVVEMPGPAAEAKLRRAGIDVVLIDHHQYAGLDRAHDAKGRDLPASLTQFLKLFKLSDAKLLKLGFTPRQVRGIALMDQGFAWLLRKKGYSWKEIRGLFAYSDELMEGVRGHRDEARKMAEVTRAWKARKRWRGYSLVEGAKNISYRPRVSRLIALERKRPTPLIMVEHGRGFLYVQETDRAQDLFERFGGFTFGEHQNWGYKNAGATRKVTLEDVKAVLV